MSIANRVNFEAMKPLDYRSNEAYKSLRTNVTFCGKNIKAIVITSTAQGEGKTRVAFHLAKSMAEAGKKVIFVDTDLRKSGFLSQYSVDRAVRGLTHYLSGIYPLEDVIYQSNIHNLSIIFAGTKAPNPSELLGNARAYEMIEHLKVNYEYTIFDTPPLGRVIDSAVIAAKCDGAILVVEANGYHQRLVLGVKNQLVKAGCKVIGAVLNKVEENSRTYYGGYSGKYYKRYSIDYPTLSVKKETM